VIAERVKARTMPPWPADPTYSHFADERVLTDREIAIIARWAESGAARGHNSSRSTTLVPDRLKPQARPGSDAEDLQDPGDGADHFVTLKIPFEIPRDPFVRPSSSFRGIPAWCTT
jgi:hypothetical protein